MNHPDYRYIVQCLDRASGILAKRRQLGRGEAVGLALNECLCIEDKLSAVPADSPIRGSVDTILGHLHAPTPPDPGERGTNFLHGDQMSADDVDGLVRAVGLVQAWAVRAHNDRVSGH